MAAHGQDHLAERFFDLWRQLRRGEIVRLINPLFQNVAEPPLTSNEADILQALATKPEGCGMTELAFLTVADPGNLTRTIKALKQRGLVEQFNGDADGRERFVRLTPQAHLLARRHGELRHSIYETATQDLTPIQQSQLLENLEIVLSSLRRLGLEQACLPSPAEALDA